MRVIHEICNDNCVTIVNFPTSNKLNVKSIDAKENETDSKTNHDRI